MTVRIFVLMARAAPRAVVFRRGPSKQVLLLAWNTETDEFQEGQWLKGRIYERRSDLSPDGELLLYFAGNQRKPYSTWTAVSRPPWLTALALWPKGDTWGGGGVFESDERIALDHLYEWKLADGFRLPEWLTIQPFEDRPGWNGEEPVWSTRLERDGWTRARAAGRMQRDSAALWIRFDPPMVWEKRRGRHTLQMIIHGFHERNGPFFVIEHRVLTGGEESHPIGRSDWADWSRSGDLLFAKDGTIYRLPSSAGTLAELRDARVLIDLNDATFTPRAAPAEALRWPRT